VPGDDEQADDARDGRFVDKRRGVDRAAILGMVLFLALVANAIHDLVA